MQLHSDFFGWKKTPRESLDLSLLLFVAAAAAAIGRCAREVHRMLGGRLRRFCGSDVGFGTLVGGCGGESSGGGGPSVVGGGW